VIDTATLTLADRWPIYSPRGMAITGDGAYLYVAQYSMNTLTVFDTATAETITTIALAPDPSFIAITP
ncbi:MAG: cell surface protein, partial [Acidobacteria bacterium]|nr:cell surface protein [Acidobacteriota bacterium]MBI3654813.1 cell surface protein [Acidobacteriota bacterium]MBI3656857.1 cell surface protein [Acidobacteriota bacterium]